MTLITSSQFASASATGADWRECAKTVLEQLESVKTRDDSFNIGFLYISDALAEDGQSILTLFQSVLNIKNWLGAVALGVCAGDQAYIDEPAISAMVGRFDDNDFTMFEANAQNDHIAPWLGANHPMLIFTHGDPLLEADLGSALTQANEKLGGFMIGGLSSSRKDHFQIAGGTLQQDGFSGALFADRVKVATTLSQGCAPIGGQHIITKCVDHTIDELDGDKAMAAFEEDLRLFAMKRIGKDPDTITLDVSVLKNPDEIPDEFQSALKGEVHVGFPVKNSDQKDYLVRNLMGIDSQTGSMMVSQMVQKGEPIVFVHRDDESVERDLREKLRALKTRIESDEGIFAPKGGVYVSCVARAFSHFGEETDEMQILREELGEFPLTGFYAGGEISNARLYGYTGILTLFL